MKAIEWMACVLLCQAVGGLGAFFTRNAIPSWYQGLVRPAFAPPNWVFGPVWTVLYLFMGIVLYRLWRRAPLGPMRDRALMLFFFQLALNGLWTPIFFGFHALWSAFACIGLLLAAIGGTMAALSRFDTLSTRLMAPYLLWVSFAAALNFEFARLNP